MSLSLPLWSWFFLLLFLLTMEIPSGSSNSEVMRKRPSKENNGFQCTTNIKNCIEPVTSKICSGNGACVCGQCACFQTDFEVYYGRFCEHCESCSPNLCDNLKPCVECKVHLTGPYEKQHDCEAHCSRFPEIQIAQVASSDEKDDNYYCTFTDIEGCEFYFVYGYDAAGHLIIIAEKDKECPVQSFVVNQTTSTPTQTSLHNNQNQHQHHEHHGQQQKLTDFHRMKSSLSSSPTSSSSGQGQGHGSGRGSTSTHTTSTKARTRPPPVFTEYRHPLENGHTNSVNNNHNHDKVVFTKASHESQSISASIEDEYQNQNRNTKNKNKKNDAHGVEAEADTDSLRHRQSPSTSSAFDFGFGFPPAPTATTRVPKKMLNTPAFDLMIVCGLTLTRASDKTTQPPQYFQRNGIHFHVENCQFIPKSEAFIFSPTSLSTSTGFGSDTASETTSQESFEFQTEEQRRQTINDSNSESSAISAPLGKSDRMLISVLAFQVLLFLRFSL